MTRAEFLNRWRSRREDLRLLGALVDGAALIDQRVGPLPPQSSISRRMEGPPRQNALDGVSDRRIARAGTPRKTNVIQLDPNRRHDEASAVRITTFRCLHLSDNFHDLSEDSQARAEKRSVAVKTRIANPASRNWKRI
jgi:hypothetical protein